MRSDRGCAVAATAFAAGAESLRPVLETLGFSEIVWARDGLHALRLVQEHLPDALVADAVLPGLDGASLAAKIRALSLAVYPAVVLLAVPGMRPVNPGCSVVTKPVSPEALETALAREAPERRIIPPEKRAKAAAALDRLGVPEHPGREYLLRAAEIAWQDVRWLRSLTARLYPAVAEQFGVDARRVERAIRHVIDAAWRGGEIEAQYDLFGDTIDAKRGSPTCGEMIARIADILRWEGKA